ncbi:hypothetical protein VKT23_019890 [Stygiomarasmius scandens]|uniref:Uncharacterized protein n=1 Tax=Marasmiellus scandens TaxID=2682957 RepID=A0ABR1IP90_9AGAR
MRTHIANALQKRSKAIRRAVKRYNKAAMSLNPPRPTLNWSKVSHFSFLDQFSILQDTRHSVLEKPWSKPVICELMKKYHRVSRAREEIVRCNVELRRLHTHIDHEDWHFSAVLDQVQHQPISGPVHDYVKRRRRINQYLLERIQETYDLEDFSGTLTPGVRSSADANPILHVQSSSEASSLPSTDPPCDDKNKERISDDSDSDDDNLQDNDYLNDNLSSMVDFISNITIHG